MELHPDYHTHTFGDLADRYPNLHAAVAPSFNGSMRRWEFAAITSFDEGFEHFGRTEAELRLAFAAVMDETNWKYPMERAFDRLRPEEVALVSDAAIFYAGCVPEVIPNREHPSEHAVVVVAEGYYSAIGS